MSESNEPEFCSLLMEVKTELDSETEMEPGRADLPCVKVELEMDGDITEPHTHDLAAPALKAKFEPESDTEEQEFGDSGYSGTGHLDHNASRQKRKRQCSATKNTSVVKKQRQNGPTVSQRMMSTPSSLAVSEEAQQSTSLEGVSESAYTAQHSQNNGKTQSKGKVVGTMSVSSWTDQTPLQLWLQYKHIKASRHRETHDQVLELEKLKVEAAVKKLELEKQKLKLEIARREYQKQKNMMLAEREKALRVKY